MKIAVLIPYRNDRPRFMYHLKTMLAAQTVQPDHVEIVNDPPASEEKDITWRYRTGYDRLRNKGFDVIFLFEVDDWYASDYIETMLAGWNDHGRPSLFGTDYTIYYHLRLFAHYTMFHTTRSSAMSTMIKPDLNFQWCPDTEVYTDMHLWETLRAELNGVVFRPHKKICLGIKHGIGLTGGRSHTCHFHRYTTEDPDKSFLQSICDPESFKFYSNYFEMEKA